MVSLIYSEMLSEVFMTALLIKDLPADVHKWLKQEAERNHRYDANFIALVGDLIKHRIRLGGNEESGAC